MMRHLKGEFGERLAKFLIFVGFFLTLPKVILTLVGITSIVVGAAIYLNIKLEEMEKEVKKDPEVFDK